MPRTAGLLPSAPRGPPVAPLCFRCLQLCVTWKSPGPEPRELPWLHHWVILQQASVPGRPALWGAGTRGFPGGISGQRPHVPGRQGQLVLFAFSLEPLTLRATMLQGGKGLRAGSPPDACAPGEREPGTQPRRGAGRQGREAPPSAWGKPGGCECSEPSERGVGGTLKMEGVSH